MNREAVPRARSCSQMSVFTDPGVGRIDRNRVAIGRNRDPIHQGWRADSARHFSGSVEPGKLPVASAAAGSVCQDAILRNGKMIFGSAIASGIDLFGDGNRITNGLKFADIEGLGHERPFAYE